MENIPRIEVIERAAKEELEAERFIEAVEKKKEELRHKKSFWKRIFPYKIVLVKR